VLFGNFLDPFFKHGVLQELLLNGFKELESGELEQLDGLLQLWGHDQLLRQLEVLSEFKAHNGFGLTVSEDCRQENYLVPNLP
jgi:hypothetical protein